MRKIIWLPEVWQAFFLPSKEISVKSRKLLPKPATNLKEEAIRIIASKKALKNCLNMTDPMDPLSNPVRLAILEIIFAIRNGQSKLIPNAKKYYRQIADNFGMWKLRYILEDTIFKAENEKEYDNICSILEKESHVQSKLFENICQIVEGKLIEAGIKNFEILHRKKNIFGIYQKIKIKGKNLNHIRDFFAVRIIVQTIEDCYRALHILHHLWPHYPDAFRDYIKEPKANGYQALHTTLRSLNMKTVEFQIRTKDMDMIAKFGPASHAIYKKAMRDSIN